MTPKPPQPDLKPARSGWRREEEDKHIAQALGERLRRIRERRGLSLSDVSRLSGVPAPTLSRIENSKMSPTYSVLVRITKGMQCDWAEVFGDDEPPPAQRVNVVRRGEGRPAELAGIHYNFLHVQESGHSQALIVTITATDLDSVGGLVGHRGEEFCYVLKGRLALHVKGQPTEIMGPGDSAMFDSDVPHAYVDDSGKGSRVLMVVNRGPQTRHAASGDASNHQVIVARGGSQDLPRGQLTAPARQR